MSAADPKLKRLTRKLAALCMHAGKPVAKRVQAVIDSFKEFSPTRQRAALNLFHDALEREISRFEAEVEHAGPLSEEALQAIGDQLKSHYHHAFQLNARENPALLAGFRVTVQDDVFDASLQTRLQRLAKAFG